MAKRVITDIGAVDLDQPGPKRLEDPEINWSGEIPESLRDLNDQRSYIVPLQDETGKSEKIREFKVHPADKRKLYQLMDLRVFPFRAEDDVVRFCLRVGLAHLKAVIEAHNPGYKTDFQTLDYTEDALVDSMMQQRISTLAQKVHDDVMGLLVQGHNDKAHERAMLYRRAIDRLSDPYWRELGDREFAIHIEPLLQGGRRAMHLMPVKH